MELRSNQSRSGTPFLQTEGEQKFEFEQNVHSEETIIQHSYLTRSNKSYTSSGSDEVFMSPRKQRSLRSERKSIESKSARHKTSDYSSEDGENEISTSKSTERENGNRTRIGTYSVPKPENGEVKTAFQVYKEAGDYWNKYPKTDYTYSRHSKDRYEIAPGVIAMPNMSRRSIHRERIDSTSQTGQCQSQHYTDTSDKANHDEVKYRHPPHLEPRKLFREEMEETSVFYRYSRTVTSTFVSIYISILTFFSFVYKSNVSAMLWVGRSYYKTVSRILLLDTWLLQRANRRRHWGAFLALLFLPLLLLAGWLLCSSVSYTLFSPVLVSTEDPISSEISMETNLPIVPNIIRQERSDNSEALNVEELVKQILENPAFEKIITKHLNKKTIALEEQSAIVNTMRNDVDQVKSQLNFIGASNARLSQAINKCCRKQYIHIESYITRIISELIGKQGETLRSDDISQWLRAMFVAKQDLEISLANITRNMHGDLENIVALSAKQIMDEVSMKISALLNQQLDIVSLNSAEGGISELQVKRIVKQALAIYDADKTGMVDYALESSGGQVLSTRCTESYNARTAVLSVLGIPLWYPSNTPRTVISPGVTPGKCWAFQGFPGFLVIQLTANIKVSAFSFEHIPKTLAPEGRRDSAPKDFTVFGLQSENDHDPWLLGKYEYDLDGPGLQYFHVQNEGPAFNLIELRIDSNHGNLVYTCLYRFRVHGMVYNKHT